MLWGLIEIEMPTAFKLPLRRNKYDDILKDCTWWLSEAGCCLEPHLIMDDDDDKEGDDVVLRMRTMVMGTSDERMMWKFLCLVAVECKANRNSVSKKPSQVKVAPQHTQKLLESNHCIALDGLDPSPPRGQPLKSTQPKHILTSSLKHWDKNHQFCFLWLLKDIHIL